MARLMGKVCIIYLFVLMGYQNKNSAEGGVIPFGVKLDQCQILFYIEICQSHSSKKSRSRSLGHSVCWESMPRMTQLSLLHMGES